MAGDAERSLASGMNDHVTKPIDPQQMFAALTKWIKPRPGLGEEAPREVGRAETTVDETILPPELPGIDIQEGLSRVGGNTKLYRDILVRLHADFGDAHARIEQLHSEDKHEDAERVAHSLKGAAGNVGANDVHAAAAKVEAAIKSGGEEDLRLALATLETPLHEVIEGLSVLAPDDRVAATPTAELTPEVLGELPDALLDQLRAATASADADRLEELVEEVAGYNAAVAEGLSILVNDYEYEKLATLL
jgi:HPt (histidine-containing phosphotransfer) domain-containing protein